MKMYYILKKSFKKSFKSSCLDFNYNYLTKWFFGHIDKQYPLLKRAINHFYGKHRLEFVTKTIEWILYFINFKIN